MSPEEIHKFHEIAMDFAQRAVLERDPSAAREIYRRAYARERVCAEECPAALHFSKLVLYRSAANLALSAGIPTEAVVLGEDALALDAISPEKGVHTGVLAEIREVVSKACAELSR